jgi:hypothetical protein
MFHAKYLSSFGVLKEDFLSINYIHKGKTMTLWGGAIFYPRAFI